MVANKPGHQGEHEGNRNTVAQGRPGVPVNLWSTTVCFLPFAHGATGASGTRHSPRLLVEVALQAKPGRIASREYQCLPVARMSEARCGNGHPASRFAYAGY